MAKYLLLKHYRGAPAPVNDVPMDPWTPEEVSAHMQYMHDFAARVEQPGHVLVHLQVRAPRGLFLPGARVEPGHDGVGPRVQARLVLVRHPELLADHGDREGVGEVVDDVNLAPVSHPVDEAGDDVEVSRCQAAQPVVLGRVHAEQAAGQRRGLRTR